VQGWHDPEGSHYRNEAVYKMSPVTSPTEGSYGKCSARLQPRARAISHDLKRSHYNYVLNLAVEIAAPRQVGVRNDVIILPPLAGGS